MGSAQTLESMLVCPKTQQIEKKLPNKPQPEQALKCPRCESTNTKFCYYNNYSLSQPRYFCKSCKRYWTQGGTLRNVPVGGGCRKTHKRSPPSSSTKRSHDQDQPLITTTTTNHIPHPLYPFGRAAHNQFDQSQVFGNPNFPPPIGFHNFYYGMGISGINNYMGHVENGNLSEEMVMPCEGQNRVLWGLPWQVGGEGNMGDVEFGREWNGILNSPLM